MSAVQDFADTAEFIEKSHIPIVFVILSELFEVETLTIAYANNISSDDLALTRNLTIAPLSPQES
jgi:hypothetical protein